MMLCPLMTCQRAGHGQQQCSAPHRGDEQQGSNYSSRRPGCAHPELRGRPASALCTSAENYVTPKVMLETPVEDQVSESRFPRAGRHHLPQLSPWSPSGWANELPGRLRNQRWWTTSGNFYL